VRLPFTGDYELSENGQRTFYEVGRPLPPEPVDVKVTTRIHWPRSAGVGVALRPFRGLTLARDFSRSHWSRTFIEDVPGGVLLTAAEEDDNGETVESFTDRNFFDLLPASQTSTVDTEQLRAGLEYLVVIPKVVIPLRAGIFRDQSPVSDLASDEGRDIEGWTVGTGFNFKHVVLDVAYERRESEGVVALRLRGGQPGRGAALRETVREERFVASLIYRFGDNDPLKRLFRYIFVGHSEDDAS
jgi:long-subunit fatty acid transport protein